jgi:hypothetical protein
MRHIRTIVQVVLAVVLGVLLLYPLGWLFGAMGWPMYHNWGLIHGVFFSAIPALAIASFTVLGEVPWFRGVRDPYRRVAGLAVGMAINATFVTVRMGSDFSFWSLGSVMLIALAFFASAALCYKAAAPMLVALMIPLPLFFHDSQFFLMSFDAVLGYVSFEMTRTTIPVAVLAFLGAVVTRLSLQRAHA